MSFGSDLALTVGICSPAARDDVQSGCYQFGCGGGAQVWRQTQHLYHLEERVLEVAEHPGTLRTEVYVHSLTIWSNTCKAPKRNVCLRLAVNSRLEKEVEEYEERYRGRELPGFINYKTFESLVKEQIKQLEEPAVKRLKDVGGIC